MNFVITSRQPWEEKNLGSNIRDMARCLARNHSVLFVNDPMDWTTVFNDPAGRGQARQQFLDQHQGKRLIEDEPNLWVLSPASVLASINFLPDGPLFDWMNRRNGRAVAGEIAGAVNQLGWPSFVLINDNDMIQGFYHKEFLRPAASVYYLRDNFLAVDYWRKHGLRLEPLLMATSDLVASNSLYLANQAARYNPNAIDIGQGCDLTLFDPSAHAPIPADLAALPGPRIGYAGALTGLRLDVELIEAVARQRPDWQVVLIGHTDDSIQKERLNAQPNITFLGSKPAHEIPAYLAHLDVLINPQRVNEVTIGNYPRKIDEYLAMGKPVVAVKTETMGIFRDHVYLAGDAGEFVSAIDQALLGHFPSSAEAGIAFAREHTWDNSMQKLIDAIRKLPAP
ncbi:glycosyltransferase [Arsenicibacter rosenii]|uniref:Glycosyl transferase family 1 n=1 Tax=Arsenicibacter rosenii TaxID=1750698 RepID=A0A1S2VQ34_9BACT|nr:glycosyltransferase [Arsenicibacter rosenii]OIN60879.1 hypothetical protein BLX24_01930 [Arsenicibacter rosenii]